MPEASTDRKIPWLGLLLLLTFLVYSPSLANGFTYDDAVYVQTDRQGEAPNVMVQELRPLGEYFTREMGYDGIEMRGRGFRPFTVLSYAIVHALSKDVDPRAPRGHHARAWMQHLVNVLLHVLATWLVFLMLACFTGPGWPALIGTLVFGMQPVHSDVVASIIGRGELLPFVAGAAACVLYVRAAALTGGARLLRLVAVALLLFVALGAKESAITWIVFVPLFAFVHDLRSGEGWQVALRAQLPRIGFVAAPTVLWAVLYVNFLNGLPGEFEVPYEFNPLYYRSFGERLPVAVVVLGYGVAKLFFASMLACDYGLAVFDLETGYGSVSFLLALGFLVALLLAGFALWRRHPLFFVGMAALLGFSFVTSNIPVPIETIFGERLMFTPSLGISAIAAAVAVLGAQASWRKAGLVVLAVWCVWGAQWAVRRSFHWRDNTTLMLADVEHQPRSLSTNKQVAFYYKTQNDMQRWKEYQDRCLELDPKYIFVHNDMAAHYLQTKDFAAARQHLDAALAALEERPRYLESQGDHVYLNLGRFHLLQGGRAAAKQAFLRSRELNRRNPYPRSHLLMMAHQDRDEPLAAALLEDFDRFQPRNPLVGMHRGLQAFRRGDFDLAARLLHVAIFEHKLARSRENLDVWWACEASLGRINRPYERSEVLKVMVQVFPPEEKAKVKSKLLDVLLAYEPKAPKEQRPAIRKAIEELRRK